MNYNKVYTQTTLKLSVLDRIFGIFALSSKENENINKKTKKIKYSDEKIIWVVCLPWRTTIEHALRYNLIPKRGTSLCYESSNAFVNKDPNITKKIFLEIISNIKDDLNKYKNHELNVISYSGGNAFGFYIANHCNTSKFISIVSGAKLGGEVWEGVSMSGIKKNSIKIGYKTGKEYDDILGNLAPYENTNSLPKNTLMILGIFDSHVPIKYGNAIFKKVRKYNQYARRIKLPFGHIFVIFVFGMLNRFRLIKSIYE